MGWWGYSIVLGIRVEASLKSTKIKEGNDKACMPTRKLSITLIIPMCYVWSNKRHEFGHYHIQTINPSFYPPFHFNITGLSPLHLFSRSFCSCFALLSLTSFHKQIENSSSSSWTISGYSETNSMKKHTEIHHESNNRGEEEEEEEEPLPLMSLNHVSRLCKSVEDSMDFYEKIMGFVPMKRPGAFNFGGAW